MCFAPLQDMHNGRVIVSANFDLCVAFRPIKPHLVRYNWHDSSSTVAYMVIGIPGCSLISSVQHFQRKLSTKSTPSKYRTPSTNTRIRYTQYTLMYGMPPILYCTHYIGVWELVCIVQQYCVHVLRYVACTCWSLWNLWSRFLRLQLYTLGTFYFFLHDTTDIRTHQNSEHVRD